jgi:hypothetical protein
LGKVRCSKDHLSEALSSLLDFLNGSIVAEETWNSQMTII